MPIINFLNLFERTLGGWKMAGKVALQYFKERMYSKHKEEWFTVVLQKKIQKIYFGTGMEILVTKITQELSDSQIPIMILMLRSDIDMKYN